MDSLHSVLRSIRGETKARRDHLDRANRRKNPPRTTKAGKGKAKRGRK